MANPVYTIDQRVEVHETDFKTAGYPKVWRTATVVNVQPVADTALADVTVKIDYDGRVTSHRVGPRGGGRVIRPA